MCNMFDLLSVAGGCSDVGVCVGSHIDGSGFSWL